MTNITVLVIEKLLHSSIIVESLRTHSTHYKKELSRAIVTPKPNIIIWNIKLLTQCIIVCYSSHCACKQLLGKKYVLNRK